MKKNILVFILIIMSAIGYGQADITSGMTGLQLRNTLNYNFDTIYRRVDWVTLEDYGAVGNGITNDAIAYTAALNSGRPIRLGSGKTYYIGSYVVISGHNVFMEGDASSPATILYKSNVNTILQGTAGATTTIAADATANSDHITVTSSVGFDIGNLITITTDSAYSFPFVAGNDYRYGEIHKIINISGNNIYVDDKIWNSWNKTSYDIKGKTIQVREYAPIRVIINNVNFVYETPTQASGALWIAYAKDSYLNNVTVKDAMYTGIMFDYCYNSKFDKGYVEGANGLGYGYGVRFQCCNIGIVTNSYFIKNFKSVEISTRAGTYDYGLFPTYNMLITGNFASGNGMMEGGGISIFNNGGRFVDSHANVNTIISNNVVDNCYSVSYIRGNDVYITGNKISGKSALTFDFYYGANFWITNNVYNYGGLKQDTISITSSQLYGNYIFVHFDDIDTSNYSNFNISGNTVDFNNFTFISMVGTGAGSIKNLTMINNDITYFNRDSTTCYLIYGYNKIRNSIMKDNTTRALNCPINFGPTEVTGNIVKNGEFITSYGWRPGANPTPWSIHGGALHCDGSLTGTVNGGFYQDDIGVMAYPTDTFRLSYYVVYSESDAASLSVYTGAIAGYRSTTLTTGTWVSELMKYDGFAFDALLIVNDNANASIIDHISLVRISSNTTSSFQNFTNMYFDENNFYLRGARMSLNQLNLALGKDTTLLAPGDLYLKGNEVRVRGTGPALPIPQITIKKTIGWDGATGTDFVWTGDANHTAQNLDLGTIIPAKARVTAIEIVCTETLTAGGAIDITMRAGNASTGEQYIVSASCDDLNEVVAIIDATKPAAVLMNWASASHIYIGGDPDVNWDTMTAGKWAVYITYQNYTNY